MKLLVLLLLVTWTAGGQSLRTQLSQDYQGYRALSHGYHSYEPRYRVYAHKNYKHRPAYHGMARESTQYPKGFANPAIRGRRTREADTGRRAYAQPKQRPDYEVSLLHQGRANGHQDQAKYLPLYLQ